MELITALKQYKTGSLNFGRILLDGLKSGDAAVGRFAKKINGLTALFA